jgi:hypothetical protein
MTAVNNDAAAVVVFSSFVWGAVRLIKYGFSWLSLLWVGITAGISYWIKNTIWLVYPFLGLALLFASLDFIPADGKASRQLSGGVKKINSRILNLFVAGAIAVTLALCLIAIFSWGDAALWYRDTLQTDNTRITGATAPLGQSVFQLSYSGGDPFAKPDRLIQFLPPAAGEILRGKDVVLGTWMWANRPIRVSAPMIGLYPVEGTSSFEIDLNQTPKFYGFKYTLLEPTGHIMVNLSPINRRIDGDVSIFFDGVVLAQGEYPVNEPPQFTEGDGKEGMWGGQPFINLLRNASAEKGGLRLRSWVDDIGSNLIPDHGNPSLILYTLMDTKSTGNYYLNSIKNLFRTFWAKFGWGHVPLSGHKPYRILGIMTLVSLFGLPLALWRNRDSLRWKKILFIGALVAGIWGISLVRGSIYLTWRTFLPSARYAFPAIIPTMLALIIGWQAWTPMKRMKTLNATLLAGFFILDVYSVTSILTYYRS